MSIKLLAPVLAWLALVISVPLAAQQSSSSQNPSVAAQATAPPETQERPQSGALPQPPPPQSSTHGEKKDKDDPKISRQGRVAGTSNDRLFYALPNFLTLENAGQVPPLTTGQKFKVVMLGSFDYVQYPWYASLAGISQAENSESGFGQGAKGYGKRFGAAFGDGTIENFMVGAIFPSLLHQDPRYFQSGQGSLRHRTLHAISRIFVTRTDSGHSEFNYSEVFGSALSAAISTYSYHPRADKTLGNTASVWGTQVGYDTLTFVVKEFWPDIRRKLSREHAE